MKGKGFTLIEMLVIITIIGILISIALPNFMKAKYKALEVETKAGVHTIQLALERFHTDKNGYPGYIWGGTVDSWCWDPATNYPRSNCYRNDMFIPPSVAPGNGYNRVLDPLIRYGYLKGYPLNPFVRSLFSLCSRVDNDPRFGCGPGTEYRSVMGNVLPDPNFADSPFGDANTIGFTARMTGVEAAWGGRIYFVGDNNMQNQDWIPGEFFYRSYQPGRTLPWCGIVGVDPQGNRGQDGLDAFHMSCESDALGEYYILGAYGAPITPGMDLFCEPGVTCNYDQIPPPTPQNPCAPDTEPDHGYNDTKYPAGIPNVAFFDRLDPDGDGDINSEDCNGNGTTGDMGDCDMGGPNGLREEPRLSLGQKLKLDRVGYGFPDCLRDGIIIALGSGSPLF